MRWALRRWWSVALVCSTLACGDDASAPDGGGGDASAEDGGSSDSGSEDGGADGGDPGSDDAGVDGGEPMDGGAPVEGLPDLSGYDIPAETRCPWPSEPGTESTVTVTTPAELQTAADSGGVEIIVDWVGTQSGDVTIDTSDVSVIFPDDATLDGQIRIGSRSREVQRVRWFGGNQVGGPFILDEADDVLVQNLHSTKDSGGDSATINDMRCSPGGCNRVAFVDTTFEGINPGPLDSYVFYTAPNPSPSRCMILANVLARQAPGGSHVSRIQANQQLVIVESAFIQPDSGDTAFRFHRSVTNAFMANTHVRGRMKLDSLGAGDTVSVVNGVFDNVTVYNSVNRAFASQAPLPNTGEVRDSIVYTTLGDDGRAVPVSPLSDGGGNELRDWDGSTFPLADSRGVIPVIEAIGARR